MAAVRPKRAYRAGAGVWKSGARSWPRPMWWSDSSPINKPIPANPRIDAESAGIVAGLSAGASKALSIAEYGVPIRVASPSTPRWSITPTQTGSWGDGSNPLAGYQVPVDMSWLTVPVPNGDGHLVIIDGDKHFNLWDTDLSGSAPQCEWAGVGHPGTASIIEDGSGTSTAAGISRAAGVIREEEIGAGYIGHALVFSSDICRPGTYRAPAKHTDGAIQRGAYSGTTIVQGSRIQLDPAVTIDPAWPKYAQVAARALQTHGAYCVDNGGAAFSAMCELPQTAYRAGGRVWTGSKVYADAGLTEDSRSLAMLPWDRFRVLAAWDGS